MEEDAEREDDRAERTWQLVNLCGSSGPSGVAFRRSRDLEDKQHPRLVAEWGSVLRGSVCPGAEWLRARGGLYLPMRLRGAPALLQVLGEVPVLYHAYFRLRLPTEFQDLWGRFRDSLVRQGTALHFGVSLSADKAWGHCRAAFATREAMRQHLLDVGATWRAAARGPAALDRLELHGPRPDTEELRRSAALAALGVSPARCVVYQGFYSLWGGGAAEGPPGPLCTLRVVPRSPFRAAGRGPFGWADVAHLWEACHAAGAAAAPGLLDASTAQGRHRRGAMTIHWDDRGGF
ncbi:unnamed protein product [Prorocentrum cordatum]|uniref:Uncharacterized protein n=1 Tax=Prorocentrum cordatum TaxID=2364126 RepID=A0ABN9UM10_9DINO|nr:unnamed protein product [Polarella glacialis]